MKLSLEIIKSLSSKEYLTYRKEIRSYFQSIRPVRKNKHVVQEKIKSKKNVVSYNKISKRRDNKPFKIIKSRRNTKNSKTVYIIRQEFPQGIADSQSKFCTLCQEYKMRFEFPKSGNRCKLCKNMVAGSQDVVILYGAGKECKRCLDFKTWDKYCYCKNTSDKKSIYCTDCVSLNAKLRLRTNINLRVSHLLRGRINTALKENIKSASTKELIGCSIDEFKNYFEGLFATGMTWDNHGTGKNGKGMKEWHIDHIIPCSSFDLSKPEEQRKCFHYSNLQPLWAKDNLLKSDKY